MAINSLKDFLKSEREAENLSIIRYMQEQKDKERCLKLIMNTNVRMMGMGFRRALDWSTGEAHQERQMYARQKGILRRVIDQNARLMGMGFAKLLEEHKLSQNALKGKLKYILASLTNKDAGYLLTAYRGMKERYLLLNGVGMGSGRMKQISFIKRLMNQGYNMQKMAVNGLKAFLVAERDRDQANHLEYLRQMKEKDRVLRRVMDVSVRLTGMGFRQALQWTLDERETERVVLTKQRGVMKRILDSNTRLMSAGYNKLCEEAKIRKSQMKSRLKGILKSLVDKDLSYKLSAYNSMKQRMQMLNGCGMGTADTLKIQMIKRLTSQTHNLQVMAVNSLREFLVDERERQELRRLQWEQQQRDKHRFLNRIMDSNLRMCGIAFRQAHRWTLDARESDRIRIFKQRGVMRRILDANARLLSAGYNKLVESSKANREKLRNKLKCVIKSLVDRDTRFVLTAYNGLKQRYLMLSGQGMATAHMKKIQLIKRMTNQSHNFQVMAVNA